MVTLYGKRPVPNDGLLDVTPAMLNANPGSMVEETPVESVVEMREFAEEGLTEIVTAPPDCEEKE